jgi:hypothetical protein
MYQGDKNCIKDVGMERLKGMLCGAGTPQHHEETSVLPVAALAWQLFVLFS